MQKLLFSISSINYTIGW